MKTKFYLVYGFEEKNIVRGFRTEEEARDFVFGRLGYHEIIPVEIETPNRATARYAVEIDFNGDDDPPSTTDLETALDKAGFFVSGVWYTSF